MLAIQGILSEPGFLAAAIPAVFAVGLSKGGLTPIGALAVPLLAFVVPATDAAGIVLPLLCFSDLIAMWTFRHYIDVKLLWPLVISAFVGEVLGFLIFHLLDEKTIGLLIGVITVVFTLRYWLGAYFSRFANAHPTRRDGVLWSVVSGFTSFVAHAGTPLMFYLLPLKLDRMVFTSTSVFFFAIVNYAKLPFYAELGLLDAKNLTISLALVPVALIGVTVGAWLLRVMNEAIFYRLSYLLTFLAGLKLIWDGLV